MQSTENPTENLTEKTRRKFHAVDFCSPLRD